MTNQDNCPDCGVAIGRQHFYGCDIERCSVCGGQRISCDCDGHDPLLTTWTGIWPEQEDADYGVGFVIYDSVKASFPKTEPEETPTETVAVHPRSDDFLSANARRESKKYLAEPIYRDGKPTGEWRVFRIAIPRDFSLIPSRKIPWTVLPNKDAADEWIMTLLKENEK